MNDDQSRVVFLFPIPYSLPYFSSIPYEMCDLEAKSTPSPPGSDSPFVRFIQ